MRNTYGLFAFMAIVGLGAALLAQAPRTPDKDKSGKVERREERRDERRAEEKKVEPTKPEQAKTEVVHGHADEQLAAIMLAGCQNEVELGKFAQSMLKSPEAKQFAERLVKDHQAACDKLQKLAGRYHDGDAAARLEPRGKLEFGRLKVEASGVAIKAKGEGDTQHTVAVLDWVQIQQQIASECLASAKAELQNNESKHFDECFIGMQIGAHMKMVDQLKVFQKYASTNLRGQIDAGLETAQAHLKEAKAIMETLAKASSAATAAK